MYCVVFRLLELQVCTEKSFSDDKVDVSGISEGQYDTSSNSNSVGGDDVSSNYNRCIFTRSDLFSLCFSDWECSRCCLSQW